VGRRQSRAEILIHWNYSFAFIDNSNALKYEIQYILLRKYDMFNMLCQVQGSQSFMSSSPSFSFDKIDARKHAKNKKEIV